MIESKQMTELMGECPFIRERGGYDRARLIGRMDRASGLGWNSCAHEVDHQIVWFGIAANVEQFRLVVRGYVLIYR